MFDKDYVKKIAHLEGIQGDFCFTLVSEDKGVSVLKKSITSFDFLNAKIFQLRIIEQSKVSESPLSNEMLTTAFMVSLACSCFFVDKGEGKARLVKSPQMFYTTLEGLESIDEFLINCYDGGKFLKEYEAYIQASHLHSELIPDANALLKSKKKAVTVKQKKG